MRLLKNKITVITGAGCGIGKATAKQFVQHGAKVVIAEFDESNGQQTADQLGDNAVYFHTDVSDEKSVDKLFNFLRSDFNRVDVLVNNAGILADSTLQKLDADQFDAVQRESSGLLSLR